jgi:hypothetical protein
MTISLTLTVLFSFRIVCSVVQAHIPGRFLNYNLPKDISKMCTVHVKPFGNDAKTLNIYEDIVDTNANKYIFTTWSFNESSTQRQVHLLDSFHEECTTNVLIEGPEPSMKDIEVMGNYIVNTGFGQTSDETRSIFIQIKQSCLIAVGSHNFILPHNLFLQLAGKCMLAYGYSIVDSMPFPNTFFVPRGYPNFFVLSRIQDIVRRSKTIREVRNRLHPNVTLPLLAQIRPQFQDWISTDCSKLRLTVQHINRRLYCSTDTYVLRELNQALKLQFYPVERSVLFDVLASISQNKYRGSISKVNEILFPEQPKQLLLLKHTRFNLESIVMELLLYCEPARERGAQISFNPWWSPFQPNTWLVGIFCFLITSFVISFVISGDVSGLVFSWDKMFLSIFNVFRSVMKQNSSSEAKLLMLFTFTSFVFTSVYEKDLDELLKLNFKVLIPTYSKSVSQNILHQESHPAKSKIYNSGATRFIDADVGDIKKLAREEKNRMALFLIGELREFSLELFKIQQGIGSKCHLVRKPVVSAHRYFAVSSSVQNHVYAFIEKYREAGLLEVWYKTEIHFKSLIQRRLDRNLSSDDQYTDTYITLPNLIPVFMLWVPGFLLSFLAFTIETKWYLKLWVSFLQHLRNVIRKTIQNVASFRKWIIRPSINAKISVKRKPNW